MGIVCSIPCCIAGKNYGYNLLEGKCASPQDIVQAHESDNEDSEAEPQEIPGLPGVDSDHYSDPDIKDGDQVCIGDATEEAEPWGTPKISPAKSYVMINKEGLSLIGIEGADASMGLRGGRRSFSRLSRSASRLSDGDGTESRGFVPDMPDVDVDAVLAEVERLVDVSYDVLKAEELLAALEEHLGSENTLWEDILKTPLFERFSRKMDIYKKVGEAVCKSTDDWFCVYQDQGQNSTIFGCIDPENNKCLHYRVTAHIPTSLTNVMAIGNEVQLLPAWNSLVVNQPEVIGRRTGHYMVLNYQMSILGGMYKVDILNEIRRFSDPRGGYLAEYIESAGKDHPCYKPTLSGYKRPDTKLQNIWIACGPNHTTLVQVGKVVLPFTATKWLASTVGGLAGRFIVGGLVKNSMRSVEPGNPWEKLLIEDELGLYARMTDCVNGKGSTARSKRSTSMSASEMESFFNDRRLKRSSL